MARPDTEAEGGRNDREENIVWCQVPVGGGLLVKVMPTVLGVHDALGQARRSGGRVDQKHLVRAELTSGSQRRGNGLDVQSRRSAVVRQIERRHRDRSVAALCIGDQQAGLRGVQDRRDLTTACTRADADDHGAASFERHEQHVNGGGVTVPHRYPIATGHTDARQLLSQSRCHTIEFTPTERTTGMIDEGGTVRAVLGVAAHRVRQRRVRPPAGRAVAGRLLVSECERAHGIQTTGAHHPMIWPDRRPVTPFPASSAGFAQRQPGRPVDRVDDRHVLDGTLWRGLHRFATQDRAGESIQLIGVGRATGKALDTPAVR